MFDWTTVNLPPHSEADSLNTEDWQCIVPLRNHSIIVVEGPDAEKFLQGQCSCDFKQINKEEFSLGAHCNPKGRMISSFTAAKLGNDRFGLRVHTSIAQLALAALQKYAVFSKVRLSVSDTYAAVAIFNSQNQKIPGFLSDLQQATSRSTSFGTHLAHSTHVQEVWCTQPQLDRLGDIINQAPDAWTFYNLERGQTEVTAETTEKLIPQEINLQLLNGVSFTKGCYTGQEIIARMHYKATLKKHLYRATTSGDLPAINSAVTDGAGKNVGAVVQAVKLRNKIEMAVLATDTALNDAAYCDADNTQKLQWLALPYAIPLSET